MLGSALPFTAKAGKSQRNTIRGRWTTPTCSGLIVKPESLLLQFWVDKVARRSRFLDYNRIRAKLAERGYRVYRSPPEEGDRRRQQSHIVSK
jgi:hypothetical protein